MYLFTCSFIFYDQTALAVWAANFIWRDPGMQLTYIDLRALYIVT